MEKLTSEAVLLRSVYSCDASVQESQHGSLSKKKNVFVLFCFVLFNQYQIMNVEDYHETTMRYLMKDMSAGKMTEFRV